MSYLKKLLLLSVSYSYFLLPEISLALSSTDAGKTLGCRSGSASSVVNKRTGKVSWDCDPVKAAPDYSSPQYNREFRNVAPPQPVAVAKKPTSSGKKTATKPKSSAKPKSVAGNKDSSKSKNNQAEEQTAAPSNDEQAESAYDYDRHGTLEDDSGPCGCPAQTQCFKTDDTASYEEKYEIIQAGTHIEHGPRICVVEKTADAKNKQTDDGQCLARFNQLHRTCLAEATKAENDCDQENETMQKAAQAAKAVGAGSAVSVQMACSKLGELSKIANTGFSGWKSLCAASQSSCESACSEAQRLYNTPNCMPPETRAAIGSSDMPKIEENISVCVTYKEKINQAAQHALAAVGQMQAAKQCKDDIETELTSNNVDECRKNPANPLCTDSQRCSNPDFAAKNVICRCISTPNSKECIASMGAGPAGSRGVAGGGLNIDGTKKSEVGAGTLALPSDQGGPAGGLAESLRGSAYKSGDGQNLGGQKGNAGLGGTSGGASGGNGGVGDFGSSSADPNDKLKINSGFYGAAASGTGYFGKTTGTSNGSYRPNAGGVNYNKMAAGAQFDPRRYIAGLNGKAGEYINGPGINIFTIVKNRIEANKPSLLDPDYKK